MEPEPFADSALRLAAIVESSDDAIVAKDLNGIVVSWNQAAERIFGYSAAEMIGRSIRTIIPEEHQTEEDDVLAAIRRGQRVEHYDTIRRRKGGTLVPVSLTVSPIRNRDGVIIGASKIARDISDRLRAQEERAQLLARSQQQHEMMAQLNRVGKVVASTLDRTAIAQLVTDAATKMTGAEVGACIYNSVEADGDADMLLALSGVHRDAFAGVADLKATALFRSLLAGERVIRSDDVTADPRYASDRPNFGTTADVVRIRSFLATPVTARSGDVLGGLFFGHPEVGAFSLQHEQLVEGIASWASVAFENAKLHVSVQRASRLKDEFLATLSHELRTPLNAILGYVRMIRSGLITGAKQTRAIETVERNATSLTQIIEDVLDVSRIVAGKIRLNIQSLDPERVVMDAIDTVRPAADAKGVRIEAIVNCGNTAVSGDPERLQQVLWNLVSNGVKFTPSGGRVQVRLGRVNSHVEISVSDTGVGIPPGFLPHVFERFRQADAGMTRERGGLGLGLAISRHLVEMHGGNITAESHGAGKGSTFRLSLPLMLPHAPAWSAMRQHFTSTVPQPPIVVPNLRGIRVLAVDDDGDALQMVREIVEATGATVTLATGAVEAIEAIHREHPNVLLADLGMPHVDGFELLAQIRRSSDPSVKDVPAAALTAYARSDDRTRALHSGFQVHLAKPIDPAELMAAVATLARRSTSIDS